MTTTLEVPLSNNRGIMLIDSDDEELICSRPWRMLKGKQTVCAQAGWHTSGTWTTAHRLLLGLTDPAVLVDHRNGNGLDNRRENLRLATNLQNTRNRRHRRSNSGFLGVSWDKPAQKWRAAIQVSGKSYTLGRFVDVEEAARAYDRAALEHFGEWASLNFEETR